MKAQQVTVRVPATTSNLGPGFDCLGVALRIYNYIRVERSNQQVCGAMAAQAAKKCFATVGFAPLAFSCAIEGDVPQSRGLGSSVTVRLGVLHALNALAGTALTRAQIFHLCAELEGHPDNAAPAEFGGFTVARTARPPQKFAVHRRLHFVLLIPPFEVQTVAARKVLPDQVERQLAVKSCANACALTAAMASGRYEDLRGTFGDHLHQPFRAKFVPFLARVIAAGEKAGALGGFLSGSGSTIVCLTLRSPDKVAAAMLAASGLKAARTLVTHADNRGTRVFPINHQPSTLNPPHAPLA